MVENLAGRHDNFVLTIMADGSGVGSSYFRLGTSQGVTMTFGYAGGGTPAIQIRVSNVLKGHPTGQAELTASQALLLQDSLTKTSVYASDPKHQFEVFFVSVSGLENNDTAPLYVHCRRYRNA